MSSLFLWHHFPQPVRYSHQTVYHIEDNKVEYYTPRVGASLWWAMGFSFLIAKSSSDQHSGESCD